MSRTEEAVTDWRGPMGLPRFELIDSTQFHAAFDSALEEARREIDAISTTNDVATFDNTITALESSGVALARVTSLFRNLLGADADPVLQALQSEIEPRLSRHASRTAADARLFARVDHLWKGRAGLGLSTEQMRVLELTWKRFMRGGAGLDENGRSELTELLARLSALGAAFGQNVLADEREWSLRVDDDAVLAALPAGLVSAMRAAAQARGLEGHIVTTSRSLMTPFLSWCSDRGMRRLAFEGWTLRGARGGETDNRGLIEEILALRHRRAALLGHSSFATFKLEDQMAGTPEAVRDLLTRVWQRAVPVANAERERLQRYADRRGAATAIAAWDWAYYARQVQDELVDLKPADLAPYLSLNGMIRAAFDVATRLFGLRFEARNVTAYHPDVRVWEVLDADGQHRAVFLGDYFARPSKRSGAWMSALRVQHRLPGHGSSGQPPIIMNVMNFARPAEGQPALLSFDDARTVFHEFGHALHGMLSRVSYPSVSGTSVARDFVELPSQLYEHWLTVPEVLQAHARHVETGEPLPADMLATLLSLQTFGAGYAAVELTVSALLDLDFHTTDPERVGAVDDFERTRLEQLGMPDGMTPRHRPAHFAHVFAGDGYSAGYYSYLWSEVLDADAFIAFEQAGSAFDPATARRLLDEIYSRGGSRAERDSYVAFRGAMPGPQALLRNRGLMHDQCDQAPCA